MAVAKPGDLALVRLISPWRLSSSTKSFPAPFIFVSRSMRIFGNILSWESQPRRELRRSAGSGGQDSPQSATLRNESRSRKNRAPPLSLGRGRFLFWRRGDGPGAGWLRQSESGWLRVGADGTRLSDDARAGNGANFSVEDATGVVLATAPVGASSGTWGAFTVYPLDFRIRESGLYRSW